MQKDFEHMLSDIYELDPTLEERDGEVRTIILALIASRPKAAASEEFTRSLRAKLIIEQPLLETKAKSSRWLLSPYLRYLAPLGAAAVLLIILLPAPLSYQTVTPTEIIPNELAPTLLPPNLNPESGGAGEASMFAVPGEETADAASDPEARIMNIEMAKTLPSSVMSNSLNIEPPQAGARSVIISGYVSTPTHFVIFEPNQQANRIIGVSPLLQGELTDLPLLLKVSLMLGKTYTIAAYLDTNQDGIFTPEIDEPVIDRNGDELQAWFTVR